VPDSFSSLEGDALSTEQPVTAADPALALDPALDYLLQLQPGGRFLPHPMPRPYYSVGREGAKIALADRRVSRRHLAVARVGPNWLAINLSTKRMRVNGCELRQKTLHAGDVVRLGDTWMVFVAGTPARPLPPLQPLPGKYSRAALAAGSRTAFGFSGSIGSLEEEDSIVQCSVYSGTRLLASSVGQPLLIGSHPLSAVPLAGPGVAPFHCLLTWLSAGLHLIDLDSGWGTQLDGQPIRVGWVTHGQKIRIGGQTLMVRLAGDPCGPMVDRVRRRRNTPAAVALTALYGPHAGQTVRLPPGRPFTLGRADDCDLSLSGERHLAQRQLELMLEPLADDRAMAPPVVLQVRDRAGTALINRQPVVGVGTASTGDVLQFGRPDRVASTALLLHYDLTLEAW
jgi:pSer/pThr/pTyr-binding forkhead associated (FHA) protein